MSTERNKKLQGSDSISKSKYTLITGGCGFVGVNLADRLLAEGRRVMVFDNLSRSGVENNLEWLRNKYPDRLKIMVADIRHPEEVKLAVEQASMIFHFAAQVAVTTSLVDPFYDFDVNAAGTLNLLEAIRHSSHQPPIIFTSTNKVYGDLEDVHMIRNGSRYYPADEQLRQSGISEKRNLDFHSPYGCTKGVADQYVLDYARTFGLKSVVFRMSCIYGPHQYGNEDQGWVAHFLIQALKGNPITLYGDGMQVRDILFVEDLVNAFLLAEKNIGNLSGHAFNIGGGVDNTISLLELLELIGQITGKKPKINFEDWRASDQKYYVADFAKFSGATDWKPAVGTREGVARLCEWLNENVIDAALSATAKATHKPHEKLETIDK
jgi:CDP-paratose 2-epimerase